MRILGIAPSPARSGIASLAAMLALASILASVGPVRAQTTELDFALGLANMLRAARTVIAEGQARINDPSLGDKGLSGEVVLKEAVANFKEATGADPAEVDPESRYGRLLNTLMTAIRSVMDENQGTINQAGIGFKGFVPAVFARLVNERFSQLIGREAEIKVTAPPGLVRNRKARPDSWEAAEIENRLLSPDWERGKVYSATAENRGRAAFRVLVPEYYGAGCLACHGEPKGETDVTGHPKEGGKLGDLGGVISVTLFH